MARGKLGFWGRITNATIAFFLTVFVLIMLAALVYSVVHGTPDINTEKVAENTQPVGKVYYRP